MQHSQSGKTTPPPSPAYAVYSFDRQISPKKGCNWRNHGVCNSREEALWVAEQLKRCKDLERIEIRLQKYDPKTNSYKDRTIKKIETLPSSRKNFFRFLKFLSAN